MEKANTLWLDEPDQRQVSMMKAEVSHELKQALLVAQQYVHEAFDKDGKIADYVLMAGPVPKR